MTMLYVSFLVTRVFAAFFSDAVLVFLVNNSEAAQAFATGSSPSNAISISDEKDVNGNPIVSIDGEEDVDKLLDINSAIAVEKEIAADTIGTIFACTRSHFLPYVEQATLELIPLLQHYYEGIRKSAIDSLLETVRVFYELSDHEQWQPGKDVVREIVTLPIDDCSPLRI